MQGMGYECEEAKRALRFNSNDLDAAVAFISQQRMQAEVRFERALPTVIFFLSLSYNHPRCCGPTIGNCLLFDSNSAGASHSPKH